MAENIARTVGKREFDWTSPQVSKPVQNLLQYEAYVVSM